MTQYDNTASSWTLGPAPVAGSSGGLSGTAFTTMAPGSTSTFECSNAHPLQNDRGLHIIAASGEGVYAEWKITGQTGAAYAARTGVIAAATGNTTANDQPVIAFRSGSSTVTSLMISSSNKFRIVNRVGADGVAGTITIPWAFTNQIWAELYVGQGSGGGSNGNAKFRWFVGNTLQETITTRMANNYDTGVAALDAVRFGRGTVPTSSIEYWMGGFSLQTAPATPTLDADGFIGLPVAGTVVANVQVRTGIAPVDARGSIPGAGGALSFSVAQLTGTTTTPALVANGYWEVAQHITDTLTYRVTVVETGGGTTTADCSIPPQASTGVGQSRVRIWTGTIWS